MGSALLFALMFLPAVSEAAPQCGDWSLLPTPNVGDLTNRLTSVTALSANDAWAVGLWRNASGVFGPLAMRWNGTTWSQMSLPNTAPLGALPQTAGVEATSNGDVWVVGDVFVGYPYDNRPLVMRWRGGSWDYVQTVTLLPSTVYPFPPRGGVLYEASALTPNDIWAVGYGSGYGAGGGSSAFLAIHWDGTSWTEVSVPNVGNRTHVLNDVVAISPNDVWAVGNYSSVADVYHAVTFHWDGTSWSHVSSPIEPLVMGELGDVVATGPNDVWTLGGLQGGPILLMHWDGTQWSLMQPPPESGDSLAAVGPNDLWASGTTGFWHWDGSTWTAVPASVPGASFVIRSGGMEIVGGCDIWCVGFWSLSDWITSFTLAERLQIGATSFCFGDGTGTGCPCGNTGAAGNGCAHSLSANGAHLSSTGISSLASDSFVLTGVNMPNSSALYFQGTAQVNGGLGSVFGDGLRCAGGTVVRLGTKTNAGGVSQYPAAGDQSISVKGLVTAPGTRAYQVWYRNAAVFCTPATFNVTNGLSVSWAP